MNHQYIIHISTTLAGPGQDLSKTTEPAEAQTGARLQSVSLQSLHFTLKKSLVAPSPNCPTPITSDGLLMDTEVAADLPSASSSWAVSCQMLFSCPFTQWNHVIQKEANVLSRTDPHLGFWTHPRKETKPLQTQGSEAAGVLRHPL